MEVKRFAAAGRNTVDVDTHQHGLLGRRKQCTGFLGYLAAGGVPYLRILPLDVAAGQQPPIQPAMVHQQERFALGIEHESGASDVARLELAARKRRGCMLQ